MYVELGKPQDLQTLKCSSYTHIVCLVIRIFISRGYKLVLYIYLYLRLVQIMIRTTKIAVKGLP